MLDSFLKQCTPYRLCAVQGLVTMALRPERIGKAEEAEFTLFAMFVFTNFFIIFNAYNWIDNDKIHKSSINLLGGKEYTSYKPTPFAVQALFSAVTATTFALDKITPCSVAITTLSGIISGISTYNAMHTNER